MSRRHQFSAKHLHLPGTSNGDKYLSAPSSKHQNSCHTTPSPQQLARTLRTATLVPTDHGKTKLPPDRFGPDAMIRCLRESSGTVPPAQGRPNTQARCPSPRKLLPRSCREKGSRFLAVLIRDATPLPAIPTSLLMRSSHAATYSLVFCGWRLTTGLEETFAELSLSQWERTSAPEALGSRDVRSGFSSHLAAQSLLVRKHFQESLSLKLQLGGRLPFAQAG